MALLTDWTVTCAAGVGRRAFAAAVAANRHALQRNTFTQQPLHTWIGAVAAAAVSPLPAALTALDCRVNRLAWAALQGDGFAAAVQAAVARHGAARVGVICGTSTSSFEQTEQAFRARDAEGQVPERFRVPAVHSLHAATHFVQQALELTGPALTISTACSSSAKALAAARRWLRQGVADAVVVGGIDGLSESALFGFHALGLLDPEPCRPFDPTRAGISLGEAAGFALLTRAATGAGPHIALAGVGETSDAHHMTAPHPAGDGARAAVARALADAQRAAGEIDFIHLHGTGTSLNDQTEAQVVTTMFAPRVHAGATKGITGHTLGAAGVLGAAACWLALDEGLCAGTASSAAIDPAWAAHIRQQPAQRPVRAALANAFGFGGSNCTLLFTRGD